MKHPIKHPPLSHKPEPVKQPDRTQPKPTRENRPKSSQPTKKEAQEFHRLLHDDSELHQEQMGELLFYFQDVPPENLEESQDQHQRFQSMMPDLGDEIERQENLPAEFSLMLPETGEVLARLSQGENGEMKVSLGFQQEALMKMVGYERQGERALSRRLGKRVSLHFKQVNAL